MATLSPSKARTTHGCGLTPVHHERSSPQRAALIPRSVLPEPGFRDPTTTLPHATALSAVQAMQAFNSEDARDGAFLLSAEGCHQGFNHKPASITSTPIDRARDSDGETVQGSSEASVDIITERDTFVYGDVRSASPRKPLPAQWLPPSSSPTLATTQRSRAHGGTKASPSGSPVERKPVHVTRSSIDIGKAQADKTSFLTKEALDAVNANIISPTLRRSPSKIQRSPTKVPWNSPTVSPKVQNTRHGGASPTKPSPPPVTQFSAHMAVDHRRAPSSIISTGATSFHTAHGSPVHDSSSKVKVSPVTTTKVSLRSRASRPELSIRIPPPDTAMYAERRSASTLASAATSSAASVEGGGSPGLDHPQSVQGTTTQSRIPRMSISKGSSARAPTLSSTLKQTKSTQSLRSPKTTKGKTESSSATACKATGTKSLRHVRTVDSTGSTPVLSDRESRDFSIPASVASLVTASTKRTTRASDVDLVTSYPQNTALRALEPTESHAASSTTSRATSASTVKASQIAHAPASSDPAGTRAGKGSGFSGKVHSSDADDEYDDCTTSAPIRGRSAQYSPSTRRATASEVSMHSSSASDLRATATEFIPTLKDTSENVAHEQPTTSLPDMYALDGYGIPWFYHMYPVPWLLRPMYNKGRTKSPKKFRPKKQRSTLDSLASNQQDKPEVSNSIPIEIAAAVAGSSTSTLKNAVGSGAAPFRQEPADKMHVLRDSGYPKDSDGPFSTQLDIIARQTALQPKNDIKRLSHVVDLTTIRNVPAEGDLLQGHAPGHNTVPSRRHNHRQVGNGLYGGRANVGVPLYATFPFPNPVPPMGRPVEKSGGVYSTYVGYTVGNKGCDTVEIERAAEHGGGPACNKCEPGH